MKQFDYIKEAHRYVEKARDILKTMKTTTLKHGVMTTVNTSVRPAITCGMP